MQTNWQNTYNLCNLDRWVKVSVAEDNENGCEIEYPAGTYVQETEGSWYEGGNPDKDDSQKTYDPEVDD